MVPSKRTRALRLILATGATVFGLSAIALIALPGLFNSLLGLEGSPSLEWAMRMIGITLVALAGNMYSVSSRGTEGAMRFSGFVMMLSATGLGVITLLIPVTLNWFTVLYSAIGFAFGLAYLIALAKK